MADYQDYKTRVVVKNAGVISTDLIVDTKDILEAVAIICGVYGGTENHNLDLLKNSQKIVQTKIPYSEDWCSVENVADIAALTSTHIYQKVYKALSIKNGNGTMTNHDKIKIKKPSAIHKDDTAKLFPEPTENAMIKEGLSAFFKGHDYTILGILRSDKIETIEAIKSCPRIGDKVTYPFSHCHVSPLALLPNDSVYCFSLNKGGYLLVEAQEGINVIQKTK